jgi:hypothetical protein
MERKLTKVVDETGNNRTEKMCSCGTDVVKDLYSSESIDTCGSRHMSPKGEFVENQICAMVYISYM